MELEQILAMPLTELEHHGVKGQKWGVRKKRESSSFESLYREGKDFKTSQTKDYTVPKGHTFNRVSSNGSSFNSAGAMYVSSGKSDAARYIKDLGPSFLGKLTGMYGNQVDHIKVKSNLKVASDDNAVRGLGKSFKNNKKAIDAFNESLYSYAALGDQDRKITSKDLDHLIKNPSSTESRKLAWGLASTLADPTYAKSSKAVLDYFRDSGYDAIPDLFDRGSGASNTAMIVLNPNKVHRASSEVITKEARKKAKKYIKSMADKPLYQVID